MNQSVDQPVQPTSQPRRNQRLSAGILLVLLLGVFAVLLVRSNPAPGNPVSLSSTEPSTDLLSNPIFQTLQQKQANGLPVQAPATGTPQADPFAAL